MNNKAQQRMDNSTRAAAYGAKQAWENDRAVKSRWVREDLRARREMPSVLPAAPAGDLDALIAELAARDGLKPEAK
jgi:hypothetical protein